MDDYIREINHLNNLSMRKPWFNYITFEYNRGGMPGDAVGGIFSHIGLVLLRQEIARSDVTVRATLREHFLGETGHERGPAGTVYGLRRGAGRGDWACGSGRAVA